MWARNFLQVIRNRPFLFYWIGLIVLIFSIVFWLSNPKNAYHLSLKCKNDFLQFLYPADTAYIQSLGLQELNIEFDVSQFDGAISALKDLDYSEYQILNLRIPFTLQFEGRKYEGGVKMHGKTPNYHLIGNRFSLNIKLDSPLFGLQKFRLIIYERCAGLPEIMEVLGGEFGLPYQTGKIVAVRTNGGNPALFYLEDPLDSDFQQKAGIVIPEIPGYKSPIIAANRTKKSDLDWMLNQLDSIEKRDDLNFDLTPFKAFNSSLFKGENIGRFLEDSVRMHFQLLRQFYGFQNHGFTRENLLIGLEQKTHKLIPILHRDMYYGAWDPATAGSFVAQYHPDGQIQTIPFLEGLGFDLFPKEEENCSGAFRQPRFEEAIQEIEKIVNHHNEIRKPRWFFLPPFIPKLTLPQNLELIKKQSNEGLKTRN